MPLRTIHWIFVLLIENLLHKQICKCFDLKYESFLCIRTKSYTSWGLEYKDCNKIAISLFFFLFFMFLEGLS